MERSWKNKNPKIKCCNCVFDKTCFKHNFGGKAGYGICTYLSIKKYNAMIRAERVKVGFGKTRPRPFELKKNWNTKGGKNVS